MNEIYPIKHKEIAIPKLELIMLMISPIKNAGITAHMYTKKYFKESKAISPNAICINLNGNVMLKSPIL